MSKRPAATDDNSTTDTPRPRQRRQRLAEPDAIKFEELPHDMHDVIRSFLPAIDNASLDLASKLMLEGNVSGWNALCVELAAHMPGPPKDSGLAALKPLPQRYAAPRLLWFKCMRELAYAMADLVHPYMTWLDSARGDRNWLEVKLDTCKLQYSHDHDGISIAGGENWFDIRPYTQLLHTAIQEEKKKSPDKKNPHRVWQQLARLFFEILAGRNPLALLCCTTKTRSDKLMAALGITTGGVMRTDTIGRDDEFDFVAFKVIDTDEAAGEDQ